MWTLQRVATAGQRSSGDQAMARARPEESSVGPGAFFPSVEDPDLASSFAHRDQIGPGTHAEVGAPA